MDTPYYLDKFQESLHTLNKQPFIKNGLELKVGIWLDSVVLKIQKKAWLNPGSANSFQESIFFSIWVNDDTLAKNRLYYNIHALKLRKLKNYRIQSRDFAEAFRARFKPYQSQWPNVSMQFGPLTLMEGWIGVAELDDLIPQLSNQFLEIASIIDELLAERKK